MKALIHARHLKKSFSSTIAVNSIGLDIMSGEIYGLVGSDGAGKTTTLRLLVGALQPDGGEIQLCGCDVSRQPEQARSQVGYLSQKFSLYEELTVLENIHFFAEVRGIPSHEWLPRCIEILDFVGLAGYRDRRAGQLSGGMKQKLGLATALVSLPKVLLLDEPTTGVDPVTRQDFWQLIIRLVGAGDVAILITTPYMDEASRCHRIGFMRTGKIAAEGTPSEMRAVLHERIIEMRGQPLKLLRQIRSASESVQDAHAFGDRLHLRVQKGQLKAAIKALPGLVRKGGGELVSLRSVPPTLEDVFILLSQNGDLNG